MNLIIVESPSKIKKISSFLPGDEWKVMATKGHVIDLKTTGKFGLGINLDDMKGDYDFTKQGKSNFKPIELVGKKVDAIYLATDPDREGEAISYHLLTLLKKLDIQFHRIRFNEISKEAIDRAIKNPTDIDMNLVSSQEARRFLDRIIGFRLSELTRKKVSAKSAGRVKSAVLKIIEDRERDIINFTPTTWFTIETPNKLININSDFNLIKYKTLDEANKVLVKLSNNFILKGRNSSDSIINAPQPLDMASLLIKSNQRLNFSSKKTSMISQKLYERGYITYPRTDSRRISSLDFINSLDVFITKSYGKDFLFSNKVKSGKFDQNAHEAIRPVKLNKPTATLSKEEFQLYNMIFNITVASHMKAGINLIIKSIYENNTFLFLQKRDDIVKFNGWRIVDGINNSNTTISEEKSITDSSAPISHQSKPSPRFTQATIIKEMKNLGIGRPSTYSPTISGLEKFEYIKFEKNTIFPQELSAETNSLLEETFPDIISNKYSAQMENDLDKIAEGNIDRVTYLKSFWKIFEPKMEHYLNSVEKSPLVEQKKKDSANVEKLDEICPKCNSGHLVVRNGKFGKFVSCDKFPKCKYTSDYKIKYN